MKPTLLQVLESHREAIAIPGDPLGGTHCAEHHKMLKPVTNLVYINAYKIPHIKIDIVKEMIKDMLEQGIIQESNSPWNSPIFLVPKKDGTFSPGIDFRRVNEVTVVDYYPLPVLRDLLMCLGRLNKVFSSLDLLSGYWQLPMTPESRESKAFSTPNGHFEWIRMPFVLKGAPLTFQRTMNNIFGDMLGYSVYIYLDDIVIANKDMSSHMDTLQKVLKGLQEVGLKLKITKCEFLMSRNKFSGHEVDEEGILTVDDKITAAANFPQPKTLENVRSFLGLAGYYRPFIKSFAARANPLTKILAVVWALKHFRDIIMGYNITVYTDHSPITKIFRSRNLSGGLARWYLKTQTYDPEIRYTKGSSNTVTDSLSRNIHLVTDTSPITNFSLEDLSNGQREHHIWKKVMYALESGDETQLPELPIPFSHIFLSQDKVLCRYWPHKPVLAEQFVLPEKLVSQVLSLIHDIPLAGQTGREKTLAAARRKYYWPTLRVDVESHVARCLSCAQHKGTLKSPAPM